MLLRISLQFSESHWSLTGHAPAIVLEFHWNFTGISLNATRSLLELSEFHWNFNTIVLELHKAFIEFDWMLYFTRPSLEFYLSFGALKRASNSSEFRIGTSGKFTDKGPCMSAEQCQDSCRNGRLKNQKDFGGHWQFFPLPTSNSAQRTLPYCFQYGVRFRSVLLLCSEFTTHSDSLLKL